MGETLIIFSSSFAAIGHFIAAYSGVYWNPNFYWVDMVLHFMGGVFVASFAWWLGKKFSRLDVFHGDLLKNLIVFLSITALVGVFWEFAEFGYDYYFVDSKTFSKLNFYQLSKSDTMSDLFFDLLGAFVVVIILR